MSVAALHAEDLRGRAALVTGAASGIGRATAAALAREGVGVVCLDVADAERVATEIVERGGQAVAVRGSVTEEEVITKSLALCAERFQSPSIAVNCAGVAGFEPLEELTIASRRKQIDVKHARPDAHPQTRPADHAGAWRGVYELPLIHRTISRYSIDCRFRLNTGPPMPVEN